ncbi:hypothetical protein O6H91_06G024800 [Diphasiastrum complanatum]|uniref:Uncharacterized protein n=2 Tax=Diphasiastrum complanatum TaxID=34168 RepID=A0ACC2DBP0_DIPCM|nr:hypothetical protein O6H91_06G024800 [Diphasiastrum complanatum]KAJ7551689.1 hypothetical protein O6H91_06G024800 [Diphasiastrum complanatum]
MTTIPISIDDLLTKEFSFIQELIWSPPYRNPFSRCSNKIIIDLKSLRSYARNSKVILQADSWKKNLSEVCDADLDVLIELRRNYCKLLMPFHNQVEEEKQRLLQLEAEVDDVLTNHLQDAWQLSETQETSNEALSFKVTELDIISLDAAIKIFLTSFYHDISLLEKEGQKELFTDLKKHSHDSVEGHHLSAENTISIDYFDNNCQSVEGFEEPMTVKNGHVQMPEGITPLSPELEEITESFLSSETTFVSNEDENQRVATINDKTQEEGEECNNTLGDLRETQSDTHQDLELTQTIWQEKNFYEKISLAEVESKDESDLCSSPNSSNFSFSPSNDSITSENAFDEMTFGNHFDANTHYSVPDRKISVLCDWECDGASRDVYNEELPEDIFELNPSKSFETDITDMDASEKQDTISDNLTARKVSKTRLGWNADHEPEPFGLIETTDLANEKHDIHKQNVEHTLEVNRCNSKSGAPATSFADPRNSSPQISPNLESVPEVEMIMKARVCVNIDSEEANWHVTFGLVNHGSYRVAVNSLSFWPLDGSSEASVLKWPKGKMVLKECPAFLCYSTKFPCRGKTDSPEIAFSWNYEKIAKCYSTGKSSTATKGELTSMHNAYTIEKILDVAPCVKNQ